MNHLNQLSFNYKNSSYVVNFIKSIARKDEVVWYELYQNNDRVGQLISQGYCIPETVNEDTFKHIIDGSK